MQAAQRNLDAAQAQARLDDPELAPLVGRAELADTATLARLQAAVDSERSTLQSAEAEVAVEDAEHATKAAKGSAMGADEVEPSLVRLREATAERKWVSAYCLAYAGGSSAAFSELARAAQAAMRARHSTEDEAGQYARLLLAIGRRPVS